VQLALHAGTVRPGDDVVADRHEGGVLDLDPHADRKLPWLQGKQGTGHHRNTST
jgi:hypothetical protein